MAGIYERYWIDEVIIRATDSSEVLPKTSERAVTSSILADTFQDLGIYVVSPASFFASENGEGIIWHS